MRREVGVSRPVTSCIGYPGGLNGGKWKRVEMESAKVPLKLPLVVRLGDGFPLLNQITPLHFWTSRSEVG